MRFFILILLFTTGCLGDVPDPQTRSGSISAPLDIHLPPKDYIALVQVRQDKKSSNTIFEVKDGNLIWMNSSVEEFNSQGYKQEYHWIIKPDGSGCKCKETSGKVITEGCTSCKDEKKLSGSLYPLRSQIESALERTGSDMTDGCRSFDDLRICVWKGELITLVMDDMNWMRMDLDKEFCEHPMSNETGMLTCVNMVANVGEIQGCDRFEGPRKELCIRLIAVDTRNSDICESLEIRENIETCKVNVAIRTGDESICKDIVYYSETACIRNVNQEKKYPEWTIGHPYTRTR